MNKLCKHKEGVRGVRGLAGRSKSLFDPEPSGVPKRGRWSMSVFSARHKKTAVCQDGSKTEGLLRDDHLRSGVRAKHRRHQKLKAGFALRDIKREKAQN